MAENFKYTVCTQCFTYNQKQYILDALNGFVMQETSFPVVSVIVDDASTDNEPTVILDFLNNNFRINDSSIAYQEETDYGRIYYAQHKTNENCYFAIVLLKENHYSKKKKKAPYISQWTDNSKYIALCEGDDYWTDPHKLQKQVVFLESHPDFSMCFHAAQILHQGVRQDKTGAECESIEEREYFSTEVFARWYVPTASIVYRRVPVEKFPIKHHDWPTRGDIVLVLRCTHTGRIFGMQEKMSVYRMQPNSVSHNSLYRGKEVFDLPNHFRCIYLNFPKVEKEPVVWCISHAYYSRMKQDKTLFQKLRDFILFVYWDPKFASQKIKSYLKR